ncbi:hypothetical protein [Leifsonia aquatica]|uniref:hypothetical protein n=1 Tax=Leifsonia aquatica TaxID=144185 RepID=UPI00382143CA
MLTSLSTFLFAIKSLLPLEVAITFGVILFALSWVRPRRIVSFPQVGLRRSILLCAGTAGSCAIALTATVASALNVAVPHASGFDGWWRRPAPLVVATVAIVTAAVALRRTPLPAPGERAIAPRRAWYTFAPPALLWTAGIVGALTALIAGWQIVIATTAPAAGPFFGNVPDYSTLPLYMSFNGGFGYVAGAGWPNQLATLVALLLAAMVLGTVLRTDANRPLFARASAPSVRPERESTARLLTLLLLAGLTATAGAVLMHVGAVGTSLVGLDASVVSGDASSPRVLIDGGYSAVARPMNLAGYLLQGAGVALALRLAVDSVRAARAGRAASPVAAAALSGASR